MRILLLGEKCKPYISIFKKNLDESWKISTWLPNEGEKSLIKKYEKAEIIVTGFDAMNAGNVFKNIPKANNLKLLQIPFVGIDWLDRSFIPSDVMIANASGHEIAMAEYCVGVMITLALNLHNVDQSFRSGSWENWPGLDKTKVINSEIFNKTLGIIGYGLIGLECAKRAKNLGMKVMGINRERKKVIPENLDWHGSVKEIDELLKLSDYIILSCDLNETTYNLINEKTLKKMKKTSFLINVARGGVCNEKDLFNYLKSKKIAGAALDTWWIYPYTNKKNEKPNPSNLPFNQLSNIIMTPHNSSNTIESDVRRAEYMSKNFIAFKNKDDVPGFVFYGSGIKDRI